MKMIVQFQQTMYITENNNSNVNDDNNNTHKISIHVGLSGVQFSL